MSEPARQYPDQDAASRQPSAPLRDWLAAMKAATSQNSGEASSEAAPAPRRDAPPAETHRPTEAAQAWTPRVVSPAPAAPPVEASQGDLSDLMAENMMLKAKLKVEHDRYDALQGVLARELRNLRAHVEEEMRELDEIRAERDTLTQLRAKLEQNVGAMQACLDSEAAALAELRAERDLWMARAEALAQPLFQKR